MGPFLASTAIVSLLALSSSVFGSPVYYDDFTWQEIESIETLTPWLLETGSIIRVKNDSTLIMPQEILDWAASSTNNKHYGDLPFHPKSRVYVQSDFSGAEILQLPSEWTPVGPCLDNSHSETPATLVKSSTLIDSISRALKVHFALLETHLKFKTTFSLSEAVTQKAYCEVDPGKMLQVQAKTNRFEAQNALQRTIRIIPAIRRDGHIMEYGNWTKLVDKNTIYDVGYTFGCITNHTLLQCEEERGEDSG